VSRRRYTRPVTNAYTRDNRLRTVFSNHTQARGKNAEANARQLPEEPRFAPFMFVIGVGYALIRVMLYEVGEGRCCPRANALPVPVYAFCLRHAPYTTL